MLFKFKKRETIVSLQSGADVNGRNILNDFLPETLVELCLRVLSNDLWKDTLDGFNHPETSQERGMQSCKCFENNRLDLLMLLAL
jgi:hypothetical protein